MLPTGWSAALFSKVPRSSQKCLQHTLASAEVGFHWYTDTMPALCRVVSFSQCAQEKTCTEYTKLYLSPLLINRTNMSKTGCLIHIKNKVSLGCLKLTLGPEEELWVYLKASLSPTEVCPIRDIISSALSP